MLESMSDLSLKKHRFDIVPDPKELMMSQESKFLSFELVGMVKIDEQGEPGEACDCECINELGSYERKSNENEILINNLQSGDRPDDISAITLIVSPYSFEHNYTINF